MFVRHVLYVLCSHPIYRSGHVTMGLTKFNENFVRTALTTAFTVCARAHMYHGIRNNVIQYPCLAVGYVVRLGTLFHPGMFVPQLTVWTLNLKVYKMEK